MKQRWKLLNKLKHHFRKITKFEPKSLLLFNFVFFFHQRQEKLLLISFSHQEANQIHHCWVRTLKGARGFWRFEEKNICRSILSQCMGTRMDQSGHDGFVDVIDFRNLKVVHIWWHKPRCLIRTKHSVCNYMAEMTTLLLKLLTEHSRTTMIWIVYEDVIIWTTIQDLSTTAWKSTLVSKYSSKKVVSCNIFPNIILQPN